MNIMIQGKRENVSLTRVMRMPGEKIIYITHHGETEGFYWAK